MLSHELKFFRLRIAKGWICWRNVFSVRAHGERELDVYRMVES